MADMCIGCEFWLPQRAAGYNKELLLDCVHIDPVVEMSTAVRSKTCEDMEQNRKELANEAFISLLLQAAWAELHCQRYHWYG